VKVARSAAFAALAASAFAAPDAPASFELSWRGWHDVTTPKLTIRGVRIEAPAKNGFAKVASSHELVSANVAIGSTDGMFGFLVDARPGHRYLVAPDPCCVVRVVDRDGELAGQAKCARTDVCPDGTIEVNKFVYRKDGCGEHPTCAPPAMFRVVDGDVMIAWEDGEPEAFGASYRPVGVGREHPQHMIVRRNNAVVLDTSIVVHHGVRYTLSFDPLGGSHVTIDDGPQR
jgi:hypothetical protein